MVFGTIIETVADFGGCNAAATGTRVFVVAALRLRAVELVAAIGAVGVAVTPEQLSYALTRAALRVVLAAVLAAALARG